MVHSYKTKFKQIYSVILAFTQLQHNGQHIYSHLPAEVQQPDFESSLGHNSKSIHKFDPKTATLSLQSSFASILQLPSSYPGEYSQYWTLIFV